MKKVYDRASAVLVDAALIDKGHDSLLLMENAAQCFAEEVRKVFPTSARVAVIAGKGNNGGDAFAVSRILARDGYAISTGVLSVPSSGPSYFNFSYIEKNYGYTLLTSDSIDEFFSEKYDLIIDGIYGTGFHGEPAGLDALVIRRMNDSGAAIWSIDIPSGTESDTGASVLSVRANVTVTFQHEKTGHLLYPGRSNSGNVIVRTIADEDLIADISSGISHVDSFALRSRKADSSKYDFGKLVVIAGSREMTGAAVMAVRSAFAVGTGVITYMGCDYTVKIMQVSVPEAMCRDISDEKDFISCEDILSRLKGYDAVLLGPGLGRNPLSASMVRDIASSNIRKVIDADALYLLSSDKEFRFGKNTIITPHAGEFSRLTGIDRAEIERHPLVHASLYAKRNGITVLLKGSTTVVTDGNESFLITAGTPGMAKAGSGDVLGGAISSLLAQGYPLSEAAYGGAYLCGKAGEEAVKEKGEHSITPLDTVQYLIKTIRNC